MRPSGLTLPAGSGQTGRDRYYIDPAELEDAYLDYVIHTSEQSLARLSEMFGDIARHTFNVRKNPFLSDVREDAIATAQTEQWRSIHGLDARKMVVRKTFGTALLGYFRGVCIRSYMDQNGARQRLIVGNARIVKHHAESLGIDDTEHDSAARLAALRLQSSRDTGQAFELMELRLWLEEFCRRSQLHSEVVAVLSSGNMNRHAAVARLVLCRIQHRRRLLSNARPDITVQQPTTVKRIAEILEELRAQLEHFCAPVRASSQCPEPCAARNTCERARAATCSA